MNIKKVELNIDQEILENFKSGDIAINQLLNKTLFEEDLFGENDGNSDKVKHYLYERFDYGSPEYSDFEIVDYSYDITTQKGKVELTYDVYLFFGCSDMNQEYDKYEKVPFELDTINGKLILDFLILDKKNTIDEF